MKYKFRQILKKDYKKILQLDKKVYPTPKPVTEKIVSNWYSKNPEFGLVMEEGKKAVGYLISIPINKGGWKRLISGNLVEAEMTDKQLFDAARDNSVYIHIYHIEKFAKGKGLSKIMLNELIKRVKPLDIKGFSAFCVTLSGINLFESFGFKEGSFISKEYIMKRGNKLFVFELSPEEIKQKIKEGYGLVTRCKMLIHKTGQLPSDFYISL
jgi:ribosomal protein S18 acetylase RimI-like enzyme